ncbi:MAG: AraC family transcriptional regulator [Planctomycetaceae bacterium]|nr:AraC family transcriptional regulator [Planctomycetaceae bacterium]
MKALFPTIISILILMGADRGGQRHAATFFRHLATEDTMATVKSFGQDFFCYVPVRPRDVQWGLYVTGAGCTSIPPGAQYPPEPHPELYHFDWHKGRTLPEYQAIYITRGEGIFESAPSGVEKIEAGTVILLFPGVWHRYRPNPDTGWDEWWVSFNGTMMEQLVAQGFFTPGRAVLRTGLDEDIQTPFCALLNRLRSERTGFPHLIAADTIEVLAAVSAVAEPESAELIGQGPRDVAAVKDRMVAEAMRLIWRQSQDAVSVDAIAHQLPTTRRSLERRFQAVLGHGIHEEIVHCRLERAKRLLAGTDLPLKTVALAAGFTGPDALGRTFRRTEGVTPLEYRLRHGLSQNDDGLS